MYVFFWGFQKSLDLAAKNWNQAETIISHCSKLSSISISPWEKINNTAENRAEVTTDEGPEARVPAVDTHCKIIRHKLETTSHFSPPG